MTRITDMLAAIFVCGWLDIHAYGVVVQHTSLDHFPMRTTTARRCHRCGKLKKAEDGLEVGDA